MLSSGGFTTSCLQVIEKGVLDPRDPGQCACAVQASTTRRPVSDIETVKGLRHLVPPRTPRSSGYGVFMYMRFMLHVISVICLV